MTTRQLMPTARPIVHWSALAIPADAGKRCPLRWEQFLGSRRFGFVLEWNAVGGFFVLAIWSRDSEIIRVPLQYGWDALDRFQHIEELRGIMLVPFDPSLAEMEKGITRDNLGRTVLVFYLAKEPA